MSLFSLDLARARVGYERFVVPRPEEEDYDPDEHTNPDDQRVLGNDEFVSRIRRIEYKPRNTVTLEQIAIQLCAQYDLSLETVRSASRARHLTPVRIQIARRAIEWRIATLHQVSQFLNRDASAPCKLLNRYPAK